MLANTTTGTITGIAGGGPAISNTGVINTIVNSTGGQILGFNGAAINNIGTIDQLNNAGTISDYVTAIRNNGGFINVLTNSGSIAATTAAIIGGSIGTLTNTGLINAGIAFDASIATLVNSGTVAGDIVNESNVALTIVGGTGTTVGTLKGAIGGGPGNPVVNFNSIGTIHSTFSNLVFAGGNLVLNDSVDATGHTVLNTGASLSVASTIAVTGDYSQSAGTLVIDSNGQMAVTGAATLNGSVTAALGEAGNYLAGAVDTLLSASTITGGATYGVATVTGLTASAVGSGNNLLLTIGNDYVGGTLGSLGNSGTISGVQYGLYVSSVGSLGTFVNSGLLSGGNSGGGVYVTGIIDTLVNDTVGAITGSSNGVHIEASGTIGTLTNSGSLSAGFGGAVANLGSIGLLANTGTGTITGGSAVQNLSGGTIGTLSNSGLIGSSYFAVRNYGSIGLLNNSGTVQGRNVAFLLDNGAAVGTLVNSGVMLGTSGSGSSAVYLAGSVGTLINSGLIQADKALNDFGMLGGLTNSGTIAGSIFLGGGTVVTVMGGTGATVGTLTGHDLTSQGHLTSSNDLVFAGGNLLLNDAVDITGNTLANTGASLTLTSIVSVTGAYNQGASGTLSVGTAGELVVSDAATVSGTVLTGLSAGANYTMGGRTLVAGGAGSSYTAALGDAVTGLAASAVGSGNNLLLTISNDYVGGTLGSLGNSGTISGVQYGLYVSSVGSLGTFVNSGLLSGGNSGGGVYVTGVIDTLVNDTVGAITGSSNGVHIEASGTIGTLTNSGSLSAGFGGAVANLGTIGLLANTGTGTITGGSAVQDLSGGTIGTLSNSGLIGSSFFAVRNYGSIGLLDNSGTVQGRNVAFLLDNGAAVGTLVNSGVMLGTSGSGSSAVYIAGSVGTLINSGLIQADKALNDFGMLGGLTNSGTIAGSIFLGGGTVVTVMGGAGATVGTLTGHDLTSQGHLTSSNDLVFAGGNLLLNDTVDITGNTLANMGASLTLTSIVTVTGNYSQSAGTLQLAGGANLSVTGAALLSGGTVLGSLSATGNYLAGQPEATLVAGGGGSTYTGVAVSAGSIAGLALAGSTSGTNLVIESTNDYVGALLATAGNGSAITAPTALYVSSTGTLGTFTNSGALAGGGNATGYGVFDAGTIGTLVNSGTIQGGAAALVIGASAQFGTLVNSGVIAGDIANNAARDLTILGGTSGTVGTLAGLSGRGTIASTLANVVFAGGGLLLDDAINVGSHTVVSNGATLAIGTLVSITGNYRQSGGTLTLNDPRVSTLSISGAATITNHANIRVVLDPTSNFTLGQKLTLVQGGLGSDYSSGGGFSWTPVGLTQGAALSTAILTWATPTFDEEVDLALVSNNDYVGTVLSSIGNTGSIGFNTGVYVNTLGNLGTLSNTGTIGATMGIVNLGTIGTIQNDGTITSASTAVGGTGAYGILSNSGTITGGILAVSVANRMDALVNRGLLTAGATAVGVVQVDGTLGTLSNSGRLLSSAGTQLAVHITGTGSLGTLVNSGTIAGDISNESAHALVIQGGAGTVVGTFSGFGGTIGTITSTGANVTLASGNLLLNDRVDVTGHTLVNSAAMVQLNSIVTVTGNYSQSDGGLLLTPGSGRLVVTGAASLTGGSIVASLSSTGNYLVGAIVGTLVTGNANSDFSGVQAQTGGLNLALQTGTVAGGGTISLRATAISDYVGGTLATLTNSGSLGSGVPIYVATSGRVGTVINSGTLTGGNPLDNEGVIDTLLNAAPGTIAGNFLGLSNHGSIGNLNNFGLISSTSLPALTNYGSIGNLNNSGTIQHGISSSGTISFLNNGVLIQGGISDSGSIGTLDNSGTITDGVQVNGTLALLTNTGHLSGGSTALSIGSGGTLGTLVNSGTVQGNIVNAGSRPLTIIGGTNTGLSGLLTGGTLTNVGTITNTAANLVFAGGFLSLNDNINVGSQTVVNSGADLTLGTQIAITGNYSQSGGELVVTQGAGLLSVSGVASVSGGNVVILLDDRGNYLVNTIVGTAVQGGVGSDYTGATVASTIGNLVLAGTTATIGGNVDLLLNPLSDYVGGTLATLNNTGTVSGVTIPLLVASSGSVGTLTNSALLSGRLYGVLNQGTIGQFDNAGTATGSIGLYNLGSIGTLLNTGALVDAPAPLAGGVNNGGTIATLDNQGIISGVPYGIYNSRTIGTLANSGTISGRTALFNRGTGTLGTISNSGLIAGNIVNLATQDLVFTGGTGGTVGTLTGTTQGTLGTLSNTLGNVVFVSGALALNDVVTVTGHTLVNSGAALTLGTVIGVTGAFSQSAGTLVLGAGAQLAVSGVASISGGTVLARLSDTGIYLAGGGATLVSGTAGSGYTGATVLTTGAAGLATAGTVSGTNLVLDFANDYVGAGIGTLANTISVSGVTHALHVAAGGSIGTLLNSGTLSGSAAALYIAGTVGLVANSGLIQGDIANAGGTLTITGGGFGTVGTLTGQPSGPGLAQGTIITSADLVFASGNLLLNDSINAGSNTVLNAGASLALPNTVTIAGSYRQTDGTLALNAGTSALTVSGAASIVGGTVQGSLDAGGNYTVGSASYTLVQGGAGSSYAGATVTSGVTGLIGGGATAGQNLLMTIANDYVGGTLASLSNSGTISVATGIFVAGTGSVGTLSNDGTLNGTWGVKNLGGMGTLLNTALISVVGTGITNLGSIGLLSNSGTLLADGTNGIVNIGSIGTLANSGRLINTQINAGSGTAAAVLNQSTIGVLSNSGLISGPVALENRGTIGLVVNSGTIAGDIRNDGATTLTIRGGGAGTVGTLTGYAGVGTLTSTGADVVLGGGNLLLNDQVDVGTGTLVNSGASVQIDTLISVTGNYSQAAGTLAVAYGGGQLAVSGAASLTGGTVVLSGLSSIANIMAGAGATVVAGSAGSTFTGLSYASGLTGLEVTGSVGGDSLYLVTLNDYIGGAEGTLLNSGSLIAGNAVYVAATGSVGTLSNTGTVQGSVVAVNNLGTIGTLVNAGLLAGATAVYNAVGATLGTLANSGTISGNIVNLSARDLVLTGGNAAAGTLAGGSISNTVSNLVFADGQVLLADAIDVGSHTVVNSGATLRLDTVVGIAGAYSQAAGTLALGTLGELAVSGAASISGGLVQVSLSSAVNYLANSLTTLVAGGAGSNYVGATITAAGTIDGLGLATTILGDNLVLAIANDYIGGTLATLTNSGLLTARTAVYIASGGSLGTLANSGVIQGNIVNASVNPLTIVGGAGTLAGTLIGAGGSIGTLSSAGADVVFAGGTTRLDDGINVASGTVLNIGGGTLRVGTLITIAGNYNQGTLGNGGTLSIGAGGGLVVTGAANVTAGGVQVGGYSVTGNYLMGSFSTLISGGMGSSYTATLVGAGITGLDLGGSVIGNALVATVGNDYIGGTLATLTNTGSIGGGSAVYVTASGSLGTLGNTGTLAGAIAGVANAGVIGTLVNSGLLTGGQTALVNSGSLGLVANSGIIAGGITNLSSQGLTLAGGAGGIVGTFTGLSGAVGTISSTLGNVTLASGTLLLNDMVNVGTAGGVLSNAGASVRLETLISVTGAYSQSAGTLVLASGAQLAVSGAASITGGTVVTTLSSAANYIAGQAGATLVAGGVGSNYTGISVSAGTIFGLAVGGTTSGTNLVVMAQNDYVGGSLASLGNTGSIGGVLYAAYVTFG
ncbi:hypothetical protein FBZ90_1281, partial [Nitrospirillum pindoramense]